MVDKGSWRRPEAASRRSFAAPATRWQVATCPYRTSSAPPQWGQLLRCPAPSEDQKRRHMRQNSRKAMTVLLSFFAAARWPQRVAPPRLAGKQGAGGGSAGGD